MRTRSSQRPCFQPAPSIRPASSKPHRRWKADRAIVRPTDDRDEPAAPGRLAPRDHRLQEPAPDPFPDGVRVDVDRVLDRVAVRGDAAGRGKRRRSRGVASPAPPRHREARARAPRPSVVGAPPHPGVRTRTTRRRAGRGSRRCRPPRPCRSRGLRAPRSTPCPRLPSPSQVPEIGANYPRNAPLPCACALACDRDSPNLGLRTAYACKVLDPDRIVLSWPCRSPFGACPRRCGTSWPPAPRRIVNPCRNSCASSLNGSPPEPSLDTWLQQVRERKEAAQTRVRPSRILRARDADRT